MRNLFRFILKNVHWLLFLILISFSIILIVNNNRIQRSKFFVIVKEVTGKFYSVVNNFQSYIGLDVLNTQLIKRISELETELYVYKNIVELTNSSSQILSVSNDSLSEIIYQFISARVVNNSISRMENYMTLNKGSINGIEPDMGVITFNGVIGIVVNVSPHFAEVISLLNPQLKLSCKVKNSHYFGPLVWDGGDTQHAYLTELPSHISFREGDTIVTSGYSAVFPEGLPVGVIDNLKKSSNYNGLRIKFFANFDDLTEVLIIKNTYQEERNNLQKTVVQ